MRNFLTLGVLSLVGAAALVACGDDDPVTPSTGGTGGANGGSGGATGGRGGSGGSGGATGGSGGSGGAGPNVTPIATCTGCVELIAPVTGPNDNFALPETDPAANLRDQVSFRFTVPAASSDFTNGVVTWRVQALENNANLTIAFFAQEGMPNYDGVFDLVIPLSAAEFPLGQWRDVVLDLGRYAPSPSADAGDVVADAGDAGALLPSGNFDKRIVERVGVTLAINATTTGSAVARVAVDSVNIQGVDGQVEHTFLAGVEGLAIDMYQVPPGTPAPVHHP